MKWDEQGTAHNARYTVVPRTLSFLIHGDDVLLLRGAAKKRLWPGKLNGVGGHLEPREDPLTSARREIYEETGLVVHDLTLRGIVHISDQEDTPGVLLFVFTGTAPSREVRSSDEGDLAWYPHQALPWAELVEDLRLLLPKVLGQEPAALIYGHYAMDAAGQMAFYFTEP
jgi:8-oxo-dGTP diphosphatase